MSDCPSISMYVESVPLKLMIVFQIFCSLLSMVFIAVATQVTFRSVFIDRHFKEHLALCFFTQFFGSVATFALQASLLITHLSHANPCTATVSLELCSTLRWLNRIPLILPYLNASSVVFRLYSYLFPMDTESELMTSRVFHVIAVAASCYHMYWQYSAVVPGPPVPYCIANSKSKSGFLNTLSIVIGAFELFDILMSLLLLALYKRRNKVRDFSVTASLHAQQRIRTFYLFIPHTFLNAVCVFLFFTSTFVYREYFWVPEPLNSAVSGMFYIVLYHSVLAPLLVVCIHQKAANRRIQKSIDLLANDNMVAKDHFKLLQSEWDSDFEKKQNRRKN